MDTGLLKVFVLSPSYHGATLLALLLGEHRQIVDLGDTNPNIDRDVFCRCGLTVGTCQFWQRLREALDPPVVAGDSHWFPRRPPFTRFSRLNGPLAFFVGGIGAATHGRIDLAFGRNLRRYREAHERLAHTATQAAGARVFVDGEKSVEKAAYLGTTTVGPVRVIHLVRDPRGYALSARTRTSRDGRSDDVSRYAADWRRYHAKVAWVRRMIGGDDVLTVRYEDLAKETETQRERVLDFLGVPPLGPLTRHPADEPIHAIGNKLLRSFDGAVELDERWRSELTTEEAERILRESGGFAASQGYR